MELSVIRCRSIVLTPIGGMTLIRLRPEAASANANGQRAGFSSPWTSALEAALQRDATEVIDAGGGKGWVQCAIHRTNQTSQLSAEAQYSGARTSDWPASAPTWSISQQAKEVRDRAGTENSACRIPASISPISTPWTSIQGLTVTNGFYWDQSETARSSQ